MAISTEQKIASEEGSDGIERSAPFALPLLFVLGLVLYLPALGSYGPLDPTDSFFIEGARELAETNQYLLPMFNYQVWLDKPILYFWLVAGCYKVLGVSAFAGRLVSAVSAILTGLVIFQGSKSALGVKQAFVAACVFLTFPLVSVIGHESLTDMTLSLLISAALMGFYNYQARPLMISLNLAYISLALAFLCKGPVALVIVAAIVFLHLCATADFDGLQSFCRQVWAKISNLRLFRGTLILLIINLPWYGAAAYYTQGKFLTAFFITQNFGRMVGKVNHIEPFWYYIPVLLGGLFPFSLVLFSTFRPFVLSLRRRLQISQSEGLYCFSLVWALFILLLFGALKTKLATYILPAMPPLAILTTQVMAYWLKQSRVKSLLPGALIFVIAGLAGLIVPLAIKPSWVKIFLIEQKILLVLTVLVGLTYFYFLVKNKTRAAFGLMLLSAATGVGICVPFGHMIFYREVHQPFEAMIRRVIEDHAQIATVVTEEPSISYFLHRHIDVINTPAEARAYMQQRGSDGLSRHYLIVPEKCLKDMEWFPAGAKELSRIHRWSFFALD